jgi:hypothetical protein
MHVLPERDATVDQNRASNHTTIYPPWSQDQAPGHNRPHCRSWCPDSRRYAMETQTGVRWIVALVQGVPIDRELRDRDTGDAHLPRPPAASLPCQDGHRAG